MASSWQLCANAYFIDFIQVLSKLKFYTFFSVTVGKHIFQELFLRTLLDAVFLGI